MSNFGTVNFTGLEPIVNSGTTDNMVVNLPSTASSLTFSDDGVNSNGRSRLSAATIEQIDFTNPTNSLAINRGTSSDTLAINSPTEFTSGFTAGTSLLPFATINANSSLSLTTGTAALDLEGAAINLNGGSVTTTNSQTYGGNTTLSVDTSLAASTATFTGTISGVSHSLSVTGNAVFGDAAADTVTGLTTLSVTGTTAINTDTVSSSGTQTYGGAVTLGTGSTLTASTATFNGTVSGGGTSSLSVSGNAVFGDAAGDTVTGLTSLSVSGLTTVNTNTITTSGTQTYTGAVTIGATAGTATLTTTNSSLLFSSTVSLGSNLTASTGSGAITFTGAVNGGFNLTANSTGLTTLGSAVGGSTQLASLTTNAGGTTAINGASVKTTGTQTYGDAVTLGGDTSLIASTATFNGTLTGNTHSLSINGNAIFGNDPTDTVSGLTTLSISGATTINTSAVTSSGGQTYTGPVTLGADSTLSSTAAGSLLFSSTVNGGFGLTTSTSGSTTFSNAIGNLSPLTTLNVTTADVTATSIATTTGVSIANTGTASSISGIISGTGATFTKNSTGSLVLTGVSTYTGATTINGGTLFIDSPGSLATSSVAVNNTATLAGTGTISGSVTAASGGHVSPGDSPGILSTGSVTLNSGANYDVQITGLTAGTQYDQLNVTGAVSLSGAVLNVTGSFLVGTSPLRSFTIINNDGSLDPVTGTFAGLPEGAAINVPGVGTLYITYSGGDGNDVVLNNQPVVNGTAGDDNFVLTGDGTTFTLQLFDSSNSLVYTNTYTNPPALNVNGLAGNDTLTVDFVNGQAIPTGGVTFSGGSQSASPGDRLRVVGTHAETATYSPDGAVNASLDNDGNVQVLVPTFASRSIFFNTVEPLDIEKMANANVVFPNAADSITLTNGNTFVKGDPAIRLSGSSGGVPFETVALRDNTNVNIDTSTVDGADTVTLASATSSHLNTNLSITTGTGADMIEVDGGISFGSGTVSLSSQRIDFNSGAVVTAGVSVSLNAGAGPITEGAIGTPAVVAPTLTAAATTGISLNTSVNSLTATTSGSGATINLTEADNVTLTNVTTVNGAIAVTAGGTVTAENVNSGTADATIAVTGGNIVSGSADPGIADIAGNHLTLQLNTAGQKIGVDATHRLEINGSQLHVVTTGNGNNAYIDDTAGGLVMSDSGLGASSTFDLLVENGNLTSVAGAPADVRADNLVLTVTGATSTIGTATATPLEIDAAVTTTATTAGGNIYLKDTTGDFPLGLINAGSGTVDLNAAAGGITDGNTSSNNITASAASLRAVNGIGSADSLETAVSTLAATNSTTGDIRIANSVGGLLTIGAVNGLNGVTNTAAAGQVVVTNASPLTVANNVTSSGNITLTAGETAATGDDLTINSPVTVQSTAGAVLLQAGDNFSLPAGSRVAAFGNINLTSTDTAADLAGTQFNITGDLDAPQAILTGASDSDTFNVTPDHDTADVLTPIIIHGAAPIAVPGDALNLNIAGLGTPTLTLGSAPRSGTWSFGSSAATVTYDDIETVNTNPASSYNLVLDMKVAGYQDGVADSVAASLDASTGELVLSVNGGEKFRGSPTTINSLTVIGSSDDDSFQLTETAAGLPKFLGAAPAINNTGLGGGTSAGSHLGATADSFLDATTTLNVTVSNVTIHFDGGAGSNSIATNFTSSHTIQYASDTLDSANSGTLAVITGSGPTSLKSLISFANVGPLNLTGAGGSLIADASSNTNLTSLTIDDGATAGDGVTTLHDTVGAGQGFSTTNFSGFGSLLVRSGDGADTVDLATLDSATTLTDVTLDADNFSSTDASADTLQVESTGGVAATVRLLGGQGNDTFNVLKSGSGSINGIAGQILVSPTSGPGLLDDPVAGDTDSLFVSDVGGTTGHNATITQTSIEGLTAYTGAGSDITYANIDSLNVTGAGGNATANDVFDVLLDSGSDLDAVTVSGSAGDDRFFLNLNTGVDATNSVTGLASVTLNGDAGNDTFGNTPLPQPLGAAPNFTGGVALAAPSFTPPTFGSGGQIEPSVTTLINVNGGSSAAAGTGNATGGNTAGDTFNLDFSPSYANASATAVLGTVGGTAQATGYKNVGFSGISAINVTDGGLFTHVQMGDLFVRGTESADTVQFGATFNPLQATLNLNTSSFTLALGPAATAKTVVYGRGGDDTIQQGSLDRAAEFYGGEGNDYLSGANRNDLLVGGWGNDRLLGKEGNNELWGDNIGEQDIDLPVGKTGDDNISAGGGADIIYGGAGADSVTAGGGIDYVYGGYGDDTVDGGDGNDRLYGGPGADTITGGNGNDLIAGSAGNDRLYGGAGNDVILGGDGADYMTGDANDDLLFDGGATVTSPSGSDASTLFNDSNDQAMLALLNDWNDVNPGIQLSIVSNHDAFADTLSGGLGNDTASKSTGDTGDWENTIP